MVGGAVGEAGDLECEVVLVGPEPWDRAELLRLTEHVASGERAVLLCTPPALEPHPAVAVVGMLDGAAIARREDVWVRRRECRVDGYAILNRQAARSGEACVRHGPDADDDEIGRDLGAVLKQNAGKGDRRDPCIEGKDDALRPMSCLEHFSDFNRHPACEEAWERLDDGDVCPELAGR